MIDIATAQRIYVGPGPEDMVLDSTVHPTRLIISCAERRKKHPGYEEGDIISLDLTSLTPVKMQRTGLYSNEKINPHGINLIQRNGKQFLYVISHVKGNARKTYILVYEVNGNTINCIRRHENENFLLNPNDLTVSEDGHIYITNIYRFKLPGILFNWLFKRKNCQVTCIAEDGSLKFLIDRLAGPNGILVKGNKLFVSLSRTGAINEYDLSNDFENILGEKQIASTRLLADNITLSDNSDLIVACHQSAWKMIRYSLNAAKKSGFTIFSISPLNYEIKTILQNDGSLISGASTAIVYNGKLIISQFSGDFIVIADIK